MANDFVVHDHEFKKVIGDHARVELVVETDAHEGPVYVAREDALYFTSLPCEGVVAIRKVVLDGRRFPLEPEHVVTVVAETSRANGMTLDRDGASLLVCEQGTRSRAARIGRLDPARVRIDTVVDNWRGVRFNSPNDVVVDRRGVVWFTDPSYGHLQGFKDVPEAGDHVYRHDPHTGRTAVVADGFSKPNGIALSPDETVLYVTDSGANQEPGSYHPSLPHHIVAFDVIDGVHLGPARLFAVVTPGFPDGLKVDAEGRVYSSSSDGVLAFDPRGELIGEIVLPGAVNFTFGGRERDVLFVTTDTAIWAVSLHAKGA